MKNYKSLIEKLLLLAWRHIEFYFISFSSQSSDTKQPEANRLTFEEFQRLKQNLNCSLNPSLLKRLVDLENKYARSGDETSSVDKQNDFVNILVKRTQRILHLTSS